jgi:DNA-binding PadR family transcriptional regulator
MAPRVFRLLLLLLIDEYKPHGYELMKKLNDFSGGLYKVGPGTIYPALFFLKTRGLIREIREERRKRYELTEKGRMELMRNIRALDRLCSEILALTRKRLSGESSG